MEADVEQNRSVVVAAKPLVYQYPIIRPAVIAVSQQASDIPPNNANLAFSRNERARLLCCFQAVREFRATTFSTPALIAVNLMYRNGLPTYSVAFVASRHTPLATAIAKPVAA